MFGNEPTRKVPRNRREQLALGVSARPWPCGFAATARALPLRCWLPGPRVRRHADCLGQYEQADATPVFAAPQSAIVFEKIPALASVWVAAPFLSASIFEHAPPVLS